jgi:cell wall-associated NlpC family hydrolase
MAVRMLNDTIDLPADEMLVKDLAAYLITGGNTDAFAEYVSKNYDSSGDYWKLMNNGVLVNDNSGWLVDEDGNPILRNGKQIGAAGIETGLLNILYGGTSGRSYKEFTDWQIFTAQISMQLASMDYKRPEGVAFVWPKDRDWRDNSTGQELNMEYVLYLVGNTIADEVFSKLSPGVDRYATNSEAQINIRPYIKESSEYSRVLSELNPKAQISEALLMQVSTQLNRVNTEAALSFIRDQFPPLENAQHEIYAQDTANAIQRSLQLQNDLSDANSFGTKLAQAALTLAGGRYIWGAENPFYSSDPGVDCSGAIIFQMQLLGYDMPRVTANDIIKNFTAQVTDGSIRPGDINALSNAEGYVTHVQTLTGGTGLIDPYGNDSSQSNNPGVVKYRTSLPNNVTAYRFDLEKISQYYDSSRDILGGKLTTSQFNAAWQRILQYSK